jgi:ABC-type xylose transport system substrate-binding protein
MAIGAIESLQKYGYNKDNKSKYISVVGIDALPTALALIKNGAMTGTVIQDPRAAAEAVYKIGMNLVSVNNPLRKQIINLIMQALRLDCLTMNMLNNYKKIKTCSNFTLKNMFFYFTKYSSYT